MTRVLTYDDLPTAIPEKVDAACDRRRRAEDADEIAAAGELAARALPERR